MFNGCWASRGRGIHKQRVYLKVEWCLHTDWYSPVSKLICLSQECVLWCTCQQCTQTLQSLRDNVFASTENEICEGNMAFDSMQSFEPTSASARTGSFFNCDVFCQPLSIPPRDCHSKAGSYLTPWCVETLHPVNRG